MNFLEICEPLFQYLCRLNRMGRTGANPDYGVVRSEIKALLEEIRERSARDVKTQAQYQKMELPLIYFIDSIIATSKLRFAAQWHQNRLAYERNEKSGDEKFFDLLEEALQEQGEDASERLALFYQCLGLGFTGMYIGQPERLRNYMNSMLPRIRHLVDANVNSRVCEDAYRSVDTRNFIEPASRSVVFMAICFVCLCISVLAVYYGLYMNASNTLRTSIEYIQTQDAERPGRKE